MKSKLKLAKQKLILRNTIVGLVIILLLLAGAIFVYLNDTSKELTTTEQEPYYGPTVFTNQDTPTITNINKVRQIAETYNSTHTYSKSDFFVCSDMAIDVWNLIKTQGINAEICAGNIDTDISQYLINQDFDSFLNKMNHAWVVAEIEPFTYIAVETTGGYLVWGQESNSDEPKNILYYSYGTFCFGNPSEFKKFSELRTNYLTICPQAEAMRIYWNENIAGKISVTPESSEYKGQMQAKIDECTNITNQLIGLLN